jgi:hypothetical protein
MFLSLFESCRALHAIYLFHLALPTADATPLLRHATAPSTKTPTHLSTLCQIYLTCLSPLAYYLTFHTARK